MVEYSHNIYLHLKLFFFFRENTSSGRNINPDSLSLSSYSLDTNKPLGDTMYVDRTISVANCQILWPEC